MHLPKIRLVLIRTSVFEAWRANPAGPPERAGALGAEGGGFRTERVAAV
jgi:hypothetical protein